MTDPIHDVVIVGAGPAGCRMARDLAREGFDVLVLEEHGSVGTPCHCSGLVSPRTLDLADVGMDLVINTIRGAVIHVPGCKSLTVGGDRIHAYAIDRVAFDERLAEQATQAGAAIQYRTRFVRFSLVGNPGRGATGGSVVVDVLREGVKTTLSARLLVGADGALSRVGHQLRGSRAEGVVVGLGALAEYDGNPRQDHVEIFLDPHAAPGWFGWTIPLAEGSARMGTGSANGIKPIESFRRLRKSFPDSFGRARVQSHSGGTIALWKPTPMVAERVMLVGDAARQVKPTSGGGIYAALHAAGLAAGTAGRALNHGDLSARALQPYARQWDRTLGREMRRQHDMRRAFQRLSGADLQDLLPLLADRKIRSAVDTVGDIDFSSRLIGTLGRHRPRTALRIAHWPQFPLAWLNR